jgi:hypothetical protein
MRRLQSDRCMKLVVVVLAACAAPRNNAPSPIPRATLGDYWHETEPAAAPAPPPPEARRLLVAASAVAVAPPEPGRLAGALERLADALAVVAPSRTDDIARIRDSAAQLERPDVEDARAVRTALVAAGEALRAIPLDLSTSYGVRLRDAADSVVREAASIEPTAPLKEQYKPVREALRASTDAVYSALHEPPPVLPGQA